MRIVELRDVDYDSKRWVADSRNRKCDAPGSWYCPGTYPPKLQALFTSPHAELDSSAPLQPTYEEAQAYRTLYEGRLQEQAKTKARPNEAGLPAGSYLASCRGCSRRHTILRCTHCKAVGPSVDSTLDLRSCHMGNDGLEPLVDNIQGTLQCKPRPNSLDIPQGRYRDSCQVSSRATA